MAKNPLFKRTKASEPAVRVKENTEKKSFNFPSHQFSGAMTKKMKRVLSTRPFKLEKAFSYFLSHSPARTYGSTMISFGILTLVLYFLGFYSGSHLSTPVIAVVIAVLSLPFLLTDKSLSVAFQENSITDFIFFEFFCMRRVSKVEKTKRIPLMLPIAIGCILALVCYFVPVWQMVTVILIAVFVYMSFSSPEFAFFTSFLLMPYSGYIPHSNIALPCIVVLAFLSFVRKVLYGKRIINIEKYDIILGLMSCFILLSGIFVKGVESFAHSLQMLAMGLGYILAGNIITNRRLAERTLNSIIFSSTVPAFISIVQLVAIISQKQGEYLTKSDLDSIFVRSDGLAVFLLVSVILSFSMAKHASGASAASYIVCQILNLVALMISGEVFALIAIILATFAYYILKSNKVVGIRLAVLLVLPCALFLLPNLYVDAILSLSSSAINGTEGLVSLWGASLEAFLTSPLVGIGIGAESFATEMVKYGISGYPNSANLFIELGLEAGIFALSGFVLIIILRLRHRKRYFLYVRSSQLSSISLISGACVFAMLAFGMLDYIWSNMSVYYLFWTVFGIGSATMRVAKREHDDLVFYYEDIMAVDSSVIDVEIG